MSDKMIVVAADKISTPGLAPLTGDDRFEVIVADGWDTEQLHEAMASAHGLIVRSATKVTRELFEVSPNLRVVGRAGVGVDNIDLEVATEHGIPVINAPEGNTVSAAELSMALMLSVVRKVAAADNSVRGGDWARSQFSGIELRGKTLALVGAGRIGAEVANRARAFGMRTIAHDPYLTEERAKQLEIERVTFAQVLAQGDVISLHVPLTPETAGLIGAEELHRMRPTATLINTARGPVVQQDALIEALREGRLAAAGLDVFEEEPLPEGSPLTGMDNVVLTPHTASYSDQAFGNLKHRVAGAAIDVMQGRWPEIVANPNVTPRVALASR